MGPNKILTLDRFVYLYCLYSCLAGLIVAPIVVIVRVAFMVLEPPREKIVAPTKLRKIMVVQGREICGLHCKRTKRYN